LGYDAVLVKDAHSNYNEQASEIIEGYNTKLNMDSIVRLQATADVYFGAVDSK